MRRNVLRNFPIHRDSLEDEVTRRHFVVVAGGGGGAGYGYAGAFTLFHRAGLQPSLIAGTSMGALLGLFRARRRHFDYAAMFEAGRRLSWSGMFKVLDMESRYGLPATLRMFLHSALGSLFLTDDGRPMTMRDLAIPMLVVTTGITLDALKHDLSYYEHFLDDVVQDGGFRSRGVIPRVASVIGIFRELMSEPGAVQEIVFGRDEVTLDADVLDAAGFSSAIPGLIHYDVLRDDPRMTALLDRLYSLHGIARMGEGGIVNNVPAKLAYEEIMTGRLGSRNLFVVALDCFAPQRRTFLFYPLQQLVRGNVVRNIPYANIYFPLGRVLNALNLVPPIPTVEKAMKWTMDELRPHIPFIQMMCRTITPLTDG